MGNTITIDNKKIGDNYRAFITAEIGLNHNKDIDLAKKMIINAKEAGADAVKFQTFITEKLLVKSSSAFSLFKNLEFSRNDFKELSGFCKQTGITFFSTPFCIECIDWLEEINVPCYKIASSDSNYYELLSYAANTKKPIILSTGMSSLCIIEKAINTIEKSGNNKIIILHTISKYPPDYSDMNLEMILKFKSLFNYPVGLSDHTMDSTVSIAAKAIGAVFFEKHFTLDKNMDGPDHSISCTKKDFIDLRNKLDAVESAISSKNKERADSHIEKGARRGLYAAKTLSSGVIISKNDIALIRPGNNFKPEDIDLFIGRELKKDLAEGESFELSCI